MRVLAKIGLVIIGVLLILFGVAAVFGVTKIRQPFPKTNGEITLQGLKAPVDIYRDEYGIPQIYAQNQEDLFFAQGYVHAQDRFWQMEFWRHIGQGRLSEIVGDATVDSDKFIRTLGWNRMSEDTVAYFEEEAPEFYDLLVAYSQGVNAYIEEHKRDLSLNYDVLGLVGDPWEIEPWTPVNTISWGVVMSDVLSRDMFNEIDRANLIDEVGQATVASLFPFYPYDSRPVIAATDDMVNEIPESASLFDSLSTLDWSRVNTQVIGQAPQGPFLPAAGPFVGSNNWVVSGELTDTGMPLLANDPHLEMQMPSIWYEVGLHAPDWNVTGFSFAGVPGIIVGHNEHIAWGVTNAGVDVQDVFIEKVNPSNPHQYEFEGEWRDMEVLEEVIKVNGGDDITIEVRNTRHGPIVNEVVDGLSDVLAVQWTAQEPSRVLQSVVMLNQAQDYDDFREALRYWDVPAQNFVYADVEGNIAYQLPGLIPIRKDGDGLVPVPGWTGEYEWQGWIPFEELPALFNPDSGYIVTANHAIVDQEYPNLLALYWDNGDRGQRIVDLLEAAMAEGDVSSDDIAQIQFDSFSYLADSYVPLLAGLSSDDPQIQAALERMRGWDLQERRDSVPAAIFELFLMNLTHKVLDDELGPENVSNFGQGLTVFLHELAGERGADWWDNKDTAITETPDQIMLSALGQAVEWFESQYGDDMNNWSWGTIHTATFRSAPLGQSGIGPIEAIVNRGPFTADGGRGIVNALSWDWEDPAAVVWHPSMRMIVDMDNFDSSKAVIPTGQSGHPFNRHYDDMIPLWLNGEYHPMLFSEGAVQLAAEEHQVLMPIQ